MMHLLLPATTSFLASAVEMVEALTLVLAIGLTRGWRPALAGTASAIICLAVLVIAFGPSLIDHIPLAGLQGVIGALLILFGLQWVCKAILRESGWKAKRDEAAIFERDLVLFTSGTAALRTDWTGFAIAFKGVFLEGLEVAFIVLSFGLRDGRFGPSVAGAAAAAAVVLLIGLLVHRPLSRVPENTIKFAVGLALITFGTFWAGEAIGGDWRLGDWMLVPIGFGYTLLSLGLVRYLAGARTVEETFTAGLPT